jgi:plastocyanin
MRRSLLVAGLAVAAAILPAGGASSHPGHGAKRVAVANYSYSPAEVQLVVGDSVNWVWKGLAGPDLQHTITADAGQAESFESDPGVAGPSVQHSTDDNFFHTFNRVGRFTYTCRVHPFMHGTVVVSDPFPPRFTSIAVAPARFCSSAGCRLGRLRVLLNEAAAVRGRVERRRGGAWKSVRRVGPLHLPIGRSSRRLPLRGLRPGRYRLTVSAVDSAGNRSKVAHAGFRVIRRG